MSLDASATGAMCVIFAASTGVIGEPLDASKIALHLATLAQTAKPDAYAVAARAIMTTDPFPKEAAVRVETASGTFSNATRRAPGADLALLVGAYFAWKHRDRWFRPAAELSLMSRRGAQKSVRRPASSYPGRGSRDRVSRRRLDRRRGHVGGQRRERGLGLGGLCRYQIAAAAARRHANRPDGPSIRRWMER